MPSICEEYLDQLKCGKEQPDFPQLKSCRELCFINFGILLCRESEALLSYEIELSWVYILLAKTFHLPVLTFRLDMLFTSLILNTRCHILCPYVALYLYLSQYTIVGRQMSYSCIL